VDRIWEAAIAVYRARVHPALQVCLRVRGAVVVDRAIGHARGNGPGDAAQGEPVLVTPRTPFLIYSGSKALTAFVVHVLVERGALALDDPVAKYIPRYAAHGKEAITIGQVLAHRAGVAAMPREAFDLDRVDDQDYLLDVLCEARPLGKPAEFLAYHAVSGGFILAEVVRRATGASTSCFVGAANSTGSKWSSLRRCGEPSPSSHGSSLTSRWASPHGSATG
jgi:CubicO group peptidase (beta-lactamase class C family)